MIICSIKDALERPLNDADHYVYLYHDKETVFYVGRSKSPRERLYGHLGFGRGGPALFDPIKNPLLLRALYGSALGEVIKDNLPDSLDWVMRLFTLAECIPLIDLVRSLGYIQRLNSFHGKPSMLAYNALGAQAEQALIDHYQPCLNIAGARGYHNPLPARYDKHPIANAGVVLSVLDRLYSDTETEVSNAG